MKIRLRLSATQAEYVQSEAPLTIFSGGVGCGKTTAIVARAVKRALDSPGVEILICSATYVMLRDTILREFSAIVPQELIKTMIHSAYAEAVFFNDSRVRFRSFDNPMKPRSLTVAEVHVDEATLFSRDVLEEVLFGRVRQTGYELRRFISTNPDAFEHYIYTDYIARAEEKNYRVIFARTSENPFLSRDYIAALNTMRETRPAYYRRMVLGEWGVSDETDVIGAFERCERFETDYRVAFIDTSFSDRAGTDRTACAIVEIEPTGTDETLWPVRFVVRSWQESITSQNVMRELLLFLDEYQPIETCLESQLSDSTRAFLDPIKALENSMDLRYKNLWTTKHQTRNKHERIMFYVAANKTRMRALQSCDAVALQNIVRYSKSALHDDEIDALAGAVQRWYESPYLSEYIARSKVS